LKQYETNKLFWGKYLYKLCIRNSIGSIFRDKNLSHAREILDKLQSQYEFGESLHIQYWRRTQHVSEKAFLDANKLYKFISRTNDYTLRIEGTNICVYSNNREWLHSLKSAISKDSIIGIWEPNTDYLKLLDSNTIIVDKDNGYKFKVTLSANNSMSLEGFANFTKANPKQIRVGPVLMEELEKNGYVNNLYFYARDEKTIQLCRLMLDNIRRIDKLVVKSDIDK
jgi:hypothetical protein